MPKQLQENDHRAEYRVERVGRVGVTYGTPKGEIHDATLVDLSTRGTRIHVQRDVAALALPMGTVLMLSIPLSEDIRIEARGKIRHMEGRTLGLEFSTKLPDAVAVPLSRWVFQRREEDQERLAQRAELSFREDLQARAGEVSSGILLVSADPELGEVLREVLQPVQPLSRIGLTAQALKDAMALLPCLVIFPVNITKLDERRRIRALVELVAGRAPVLLLGTDVEGSPLFELSKEWKTASAINWNPSRGAFLQRLAQGIIRRNTQGGDAPLAPAEPQS